MESFIERYCHLVGRTEGFELQGREGVAGGCKLDQETLAPVRIHSPDTEGMSWKMAYRVLCSPAGDKVSGLLAVLHIASDTSAPSEH